jgi:hypothetical protein
MGKTLDTNAYAHQLDETAVETRQARLSVIHKK